MRMRDKEDKRKEKKRKEEKEKWSKRKIKLICSNLYASRCHDALVKGEGITVKFQE